MGLFNAPHGGSASSGGERPSVVPLVGNQERAVAGIEAEKVEQSDHRRLSHAGRGTDAGRVRRPAIGDRRITPERATILVAARKHQEIDQSPVETDEG